MILGIFDSGLGGLTVLKEILKKNTFTKIIYFGDTARVPYGDKDKATLLQYAKEDIAFLRNKGAEKIVVACGTISSNVLDEIKNDYDFPLVGIIEGACQMAKEATKNKKIGVIATQATINTHVFKNKLTDYEVYEVACPRFTPLIENGKKNDPEMEDAIKEYLTSLKDNNIDTLIFGCTHYPLLCDKINEFFQYQVKLINAGEILSKELNEGELRKPSIEMYVSGSTKDFSLKAKELINIKEVDEAKNK